MVRYLFHITNGETFTTSEELSDDDAACQQALETVRDFQESVTTRGGAWSITVHRDEEPIYQIEVSAKRLG